MSDIGATAFPTQLAVTCGFCGNSNDIKWFCKSCAESLCNTCKISHPTIPMFKNHIIVPRSNDVMRLYGPSKIAEQCRIHPEKEISTYCNDCNVPCCVTCLVQSHQQHKFSTIEDMYLSAENMLNDRVNNLEKNVMPTLDKMTDKANEDQHEKRVQIDRVTKEINTFRAELKQALDVSCDDLIEKLNQNDIELENLIARIEAKKRQVRELIKEINEIIQKGDLSMIKYSPPSPGTLFPEVPTLKIAIPVFTPRRDILTNIKEKVGIVEWTEINSKSDQTPSISATFDNSIIHINKVKSFQSKMDVSSITTAGKNTAWVMYEINDTIYLYDSNGKVVRSITVKGSDGIYDMVIKQSGEMIVTCRDKKVRRVSVSGEVSTLIDTSPFYPEGVCLTDSEDVVVCMGGQDKRNHVAVYSPDTGTKLREIRGIDGQGKQHITDPYSVVYNGKDLCVVNWSPNNVVYVDERGDVRWVYNGKDLCVVNDYPSYNVVCVDERGYVWWVYDGKEAKLSKSFGPRGISVDKYNNLLVSDANNNCVHYIDKQGRLIQIILTREQTGLSVHWGICVDDNTGQVWVGNLSENVVICKYFS